MKPCLRNGLFTLALVFAAPLIGCASTLVPSPEMAWQDHDKIKTTQVILADHERAIKTLDMRLAADTRVLNERSLIEEKKINQILEELTKIREDLRKVPMDGQNFKELDERLKRLEASVEVMWPKVVKRK